MASSSDKKARGAGDGAIGGVNIVPVIDLCLVLLVILLIISPILDSPPVEVELPKATTKEEKEDNITITMAPDGRMAVNTEEIDRQDLSKAVKILLGQHGPNVLVVIRSDRDVQYGQLTELLKEVKKAGASNISLGTEQNTNGNGAP